MGTAVLLGLTLAANALAADAVAQEQARALVREAKSAFDAGNFTKAATLLEQAVSAAPTPATVYNLARARELAGDLGGSLQSYRRYLELSPNASDRKVVEATLIHLQKTLDERARPAIPLVTPKPMPRAPNYWGPALTGGAGLVALGFSIGLGVVATNNQRAAQQSAYVGEAIEAENMAYESAFGSTVLAIAAGVSIAGALVWALLTRLWEPARAP